MILRSNWAILLLIFKHKSFVDILIKKEEERKNVQVARNNDLRAAKRAKKDVFLSATNTQKHRKENEQIKRWI